MSRAEAQAEALNRCVVEIFPIFLRADQIFWLRLDDRPSWQAGCALSAHPHEAVLAALERLGGGPFVIHSTSWRYERGRLILTYLAVLPELHAPREGFHAIEVPRATLARGAAEQAPVSVGAEQVLEHALRHLAWLSRDDPAVRFALGLGWTQALSGYLPEPFSSIGAVSGSLA